MAALARARGFTLIQMAIVMAIGLILILGGMKFMPQLLGASRVQDEIRNVQTLVTNIRNAYRGQYDNLTTARVIQMGLAPGLVKNNALAGNFGWIVVGPWPGNRFSVTMGNFAPKDCVNLAAGLLGVADQLQVWPVAWVKTPTNGNPAADAVAGACNGNGGDGVAIIVVAS